MDEIPAPVRLAHPSGAMAEILVQHGAILNRLHVVRSNRHLQLVEPMDTDNLPTTWGKLRGVPVLFPFPGRVKDAHYDVLGRSYTGLPLNDPDLPGNHLHGLVATLPWALLTRSDDSCTSQVTHEDLPPPVHEAYPFAFELRLTHRLSADSLRFEITVNNLGNGPLPFGFGLHPYLPLPFCTDGRRDECTLELPATHHWPQEDFMPVGRLEPVPQDLDLRRPRRIDALAGEPPNAVYGLADLSPARPVATLHDPTTKTRLDMFVEGDWRALVVFRPPEGPSICVEPQTCIPNAVNLDDAEADTGWLELPAGQSWSGTVTLRCSEA